MVRRAQVRAEPSAACEDPGSRPMQIQTSSVPSAKPQEFHPSRRVAASFNQRTSGNGAIALRFHAQPLYRAVPECER